jgi:hypothetical protein
MLTKKSKFKSFILSAVPGLGHIYQGFSNRGVIFLGSFICIMFLMEFLQGSGGYHNSVFSNNLLYGYRHILELGVLIIWAASVIDNLILFDKRKNGVFSITATEEGAALDQLNDLTKSSNKNLLAILLNIVPGAGHIFLGLKEKGFQLTTYFFILYFISEISGLDILNIPVALLWLYCILDTINLTTYTTYESKETELVKFDAFSMLSSLKTKLHWLGGILITLGLLVIFNRAAVDFIDPEFLRLFNQYFKDGLVSIILIVLGIKMVLGNKKSNSQVGERN